MSNLDCYNNNLSPVDEKVDFTKWSDKMKKKTTKSYSKSSNKLFRLVTHQENASVRIGYS